jgi:hypothetical protein
MCWKGVLEKVAVTAGELICAAMLRVPTAAEAKSKAISVITDYHLSFHPTSAPLVSTISGCHTQCKQGADKN